MVYRSTDREVLTPKGPVGGLLLLMAGKYLRCPKAKTISPLSHENTFKVNHVEHFSNLREKEKKKGGGGKERRRPSRTSADRCMRGRVTKPSYSECS